MGRAQYYNSEHYNYCVSAAQLDSAVTMCRPQRARILGHKYFWLRISEYMSPSIYYFSILYHESQYIKRKRWATKIDKKMDE